MKNYLSKGFLFSMAFAALMAGHEAGAQTANSASGSNSSAGSQSGSASGAAAIVNQTTNVPSNTTATYNSTSNERLSGGVNNTLTNQGHTTSDVTVRTTPTVYAPPVSGGNPCTLALSVGGSFIGWGAAAGGTFVDKDCADRQKIAMIHNAGYQQAARELMCNDKETYAAFRYSATPCAPRAAWDPAGPPVAAPLPAPVVTPMRSAEVVKDRSTLPRCSRTVVDNCWSP